MGDGAEVCIAGNLFPGSDFGFCSGCFIAEQGDGIGADGQVYGRVVAGGSEEDDGSQFSRISRLVAMIEGGVAACLSDGGIVCRQWVAGIDIGVAGQEFGAEEARGGGCHVDTQCAQFQV